MAARIHAQIGVRVERIDHDVDVRHPLARVSPSVRSLTGIRQHHGAAPTATCPILCDVGGQTAKSSALLVPPKQLGAGIPLTRIDLQNSRTRQRDPLVGKTQ